MTIFKSKPIVKIKYGRKAVTYLENKYHDIYSKVENHDTIVYNEKNISSISTSISNNSSDFQLGVISSTGNIEIRDYNKHIYELATERFIGDMIEISVYCGKELINTYYSTKDWKFSNNNKVVSIEVKSSLSLLDNINVIGIAPIGNVNGMELLSTLLGITAQNVPFRYEFNISNEVVEHLEKFNFASVFIAQGTLKSVWDKFCYACLLKIYENNGKIFIERF